MNFMTTAKTDIGIKKQSNEDSVTLKVADTDLGKAAFCLVCDGLGGLAKGELASATLIKEFSDWFSARLPALIYAGLDEVELKNQWESIIYNQNLKIMQYAKGLNLNIGTTVAALLLFQGKYYTMSVGDSRVYFLSDSLYQVTKDHSFVAREIELGNITPEQAHVHPRRSVLLQCVGASPMVVPDFFSGEFALGTVFMVCSDGFIHEVTTEEIWNSFNPAVLQSENIMYSNLSNLIEVNKQRHETDNITVALIKTY